MTSAKSLERLKTVHRQNARQEMIDMAKHINSDVEDWSEATADRFVLLVNDKTLFKDGLKSIEKSFKHSPESKDIDGVKAALDKVVRIAKATKVLSQGLESSDVEDCKSAYTAAREQLLGIGGNLQLILASHDILKSLYYNVQTKCNQVALSTHKVVSQLISSPEPTQKRFAPIISPNRPSGRRHENPFASPSHRSSATPPPSNNRSSRNTAPPSKQSSGPLKKRPLARISTDNTEQPLSKRQKSVQLRASSTTNRPNKKTRRHAKERSKPGIGDSHLQSLRTENSRLDKNMRFVRKLVQIGVRIGRSG